MEVWTSAFIASGRMLSGPAALPDFKDLMALLASALVGGLVFTFSWFAPGGMSGGTWGGGLSRISWKCSAHLAPSLASSVMVSLFLSFTGLEGPCSSMTVLLCRPHTASSCLFCQLLFLLLLLGRV